MSGRATALVVAGGAIALVAAQDLAPGFALYHGWQYALVLALALVLLASYALGAWRGRDGTVGRRFALALAGAAIVDVAGLASGLLGPDTATVSGAPGTVVPLPSLGAAAFFASADAAAIARGGAPIVVRRRDRRPIVLANGTPRPLREFVLATSARPAVYVDASDAHGAHLTVTQPTGTSFLSPVLLFGARQRITETLNVPVDAFATPALHRTFRALYFTPRDVAAFPHRIGDPSRPAVIFAASDDAGRPLGIALSQGAPLVLGGVHLQVTLGTYPALTVASAPEPWALALGLGVFVLGVAWAIVVR